MSRAPQKPTLEELLRLKRAERPADAFWARFEAELRAKQLAALVEKPSWAALLRARLARLALPLGAVAACAVAVVTWVQTRPAAPAPVVATVAPPVATVTPEPAPTVIVAVAAEPAPLPVPPVVAVAVADSVVPVPLPVSPPEASAVVADTVAAPVAEPVVIAGRFAVPMPDGLNLSGGTLAAVIAPVAAADHGLPLAGFTDIFAPSSARLPAAEVTRVVSKDDVRVGEKVLRNLDEERLFASSRRLVALDAGRVSVKFW